MRSVLIDTDVLINFLRGSEEARDFLLAASEDGALCCSAITVAEIHAGMRRHEKKATDDLLSSLIVVAIDRHVAEKAGSYKREIKKQDFDLDDCLVAASAFSTGALLVTGNAKHYPMTDIEKTVLRKETTSI
jgi:predicted nucleic acid-binding protein